MNIKERCSSWLSLYENLVELYQVMGPSNISTTHLLLFPKLILYGILLSRSYGSLKYGYWFSNPYYNQKQIHNQIHDPI